METRFDSRLDIMETAFNGLIRALTQPRPLISESEFESAESSNTTRSTGADDSTRASSI